MSKDVVKDNVKDKDIDKDIVKDNTIDNAIDSTKESRTVTNDVKWQDITEGGMIPWAGNAAMYETGSWRSMAPVWNREKCKNCCMCFYVCPDSSIYMSEEPRMSGIDYVHCKGCGVCVKACKFGAIDFVEEHK